MLFKVDDDIIREYAKDRNIPEKHVRDLYKSIIWYIKNHLSNPHSGRLSLKSFGTLIKNYEKEGMMDKAITVKNLTTELREFFNDIDKELKRNPNRKC